MEQFSEDAFKIASIACQLSGSEAPTQKDFSRAIQILEQSQRASEFYRENGSLIGFELWPPTSFEELLRLNTVNPEIVNLGKVVSRRGLIDRIRKRFPSSEELKKLEAAWISKDEIKAKRGGAPSTASDRDVARQLQIMKVGLADAKQEPYRLMDSLRSSEEVIESGYVTRIEMFFLDQRTMDGSYSLEFVKSD